MRSPVAAEWWRSWFGPDYLALYDPILSERAPGEVDQLETLLGLNPPTRVLDLACGQGRHAIELARRGYDVSGLDLSPYLLGVAARRAADAGVKVRWIEGDMRRPPREDGFDLVINLFTSLGYFEDDADNQAVLEGAARSLVTGGRFVLEVLNGDQKIRTLLEREWFTVGAATILDEQRLDRARRRLSVRRTVVRDGTSLTQDHSIRLYSGSELERGLRSAGFTHVELYGGWDREPATPRSVRLLAVARRGA